MSNPITSEDIGKIVSFNVYPAAILGTGFNFVKIKGILDARSAFQYIDPPSLHANVYPTLPVGTPNRYDAYTYGKLDLPNGDETCVGMAWINGSTLQVHENTGFTVAIVDSSPDRFAALRNALIQAGFTKFKITPT